MFKLLQPILFSNSIIYYGVKKRILFILCLIIAILFYCLLNFTVFLYFISPSIVSYIFKVICCYLCFIFELQTFFNIFIFNYFKIYKFFFINNSTRTNTSTKFTSTHLLASGKRFFSSYINKINSKPLDLNCFNINKSNQCEAIIKSKKSKLFNSRCVYNAKFDRFCGKHKNYHLVVNVNQTIVKNSCINAEVFNARKADQFYTNQSLVNFCIKAYTNCVKINKNKDIFIEPSAGSGSFISSINKLCDNRIFIDTDPKHPSIQKIDFLYFNENFNSFNKIHIIGNPPFKLINKFIKKSSKIADVIGFILPLSFRKESRKRLFPLNFHCIYDNILPNSYFSLGKSIFKIPTVFQI